jgi:hypothetical protein
MNKNKALTILQSIHKDVCGNWTIPHSYKRVEREVILSNGEKATLAVEDDVYEFLDYVKKLIESEEN